MAIDEKHFTLTVHRELVEQRIGTMDDDVWILLAHRVQDSQDWLHDEMEEFVRILEDEHKDD